MASTVVVDLLEQCAAVVMNNTANALLAVGASPALVHAVEEVEEFTAISRALVINIGTLSPRWVDAMRLAAGRWPDCIPRSSAVTLQRSWCSPVPHNGHPMMARVTGPGCTATAIVGAFVGSNEDRLGFVATPHFFLLKADGTPVVQMRGVVPRDSLVRALDRLRAAN